MNEEDYKLFQLIRKRPINNCIDLSKNMIGRRNGFVYFTVNFRIDFENKMSELANLQAEKEKKDKIIDEMAETLRYYNGMQQEQCFCIDICGEKECDMKNCKERIKQYFERKVENGN